MSKSEKKPADALSVAADCDKHAADLRESLPTIAQAFADAAAVMRAQHAALTEAECKHTMTFTVTKELVAAGRDDREPGKYCMTCGKPVPKPERPKSDRKSAAAGDADDDQHQEA